MKDLEQCDILSIDLETTSVDPMTAEIVGISLSIKPDTGFYIPIVYPEKKNNNFGDDENSLATMTFCIFPPDNESTLDLPSLVLIP